MRNMPRGKLYFNEFSRSQFVPDGEGAYPRRQNFVMDGVVGTDNGQFIELTLPPSNAYTTYVVPGNDTGVVGDGVANDRAALNTLANSTITSVGGTITFTPGTYLANSDMTFPRHVELVFQAGAVLKPAAGVSVSILGSFRAGTCARVFDCSASGAKVLMPGKRVLPEWWGAKADGQEYEAITTGTIAQGSAKLRVVSAAGLAVGAKIVIAGVAGLKTISAISGTAITIDAASDVSALRADVTLVVNGQDNRAAILSALDSVSVTGGTVAFTDESGVYDFSGQFVLNNAYTRLTIEGESINTRLRHMSDTAYGAAGLDAGMFTLNGASRSVTVRNFRISGASTADYVECFRFNQVRTILCDRIMFGRCGLEGMTSPNTQACSNWQVRNCIAEYVAIKEYKLAAYNINALRSSITDSFARNCGLAVEQTGVGFVCTGNLFEDIFERAIQFHSTTYRNEQAIISNNIVRNATFGAAVQDSIHSQGKAIVSGNQFINCQCGVSVWAESDDGITNVNSNNGNIVQGNHFLGGALSQSAIQVGTGNNTVQFNVIERVTNTCTGTITRGTTTGTISDGALDMTLASATGIAAGYILTCAGVTGTYYVTDVVGSVVTLDRPAVGAAAGGAVVWNSPLTLPLIGNGIYVGSTVTIAGVTGTKTVTYVGGSVNQEIRLDTPADAAVTGAQCAFNTARWAYAINCLADDQTLIKNNTIRGSCYSTMAIRVVGREPAVADNDFETIGETIGEAVFGFQSSLTGASIATSTTDAFSRFTYGKYKASTLRTKGVTPFALHWKPGDRAINSSCGAAGIPGWVCTAEGHGGVLNPLVTTGTITGGTDQLVVGGASGIIVGAQVRVFGIEGAYTVAAIVGTTLTLNTTVPTGAASALTIVGSVTCEITSAATRTFTASTFSGFYLGMKVTIPGVGARTIESMAGYDMTWSSSEAVSGTTVPAGTPVLLTQATWKAEAAVAA